MLFLCLLAVRAAAAAAAAGCEPQDPSAKIGATSYVAKMADTFIRLGVPASYTYKQTVLYRGFELAYELTKNATLLSWYSNQLHIVRQNGTIDNFNWKKYSLDNYRFGESLLYWYLATNSTKYKTAADRIKSMLDAHPRNAEGGFWHRAPEYRNQMWLDGIFMADSFYAWYTSLFQPFNTTAWDDIALQYELVWKHCHNASTNLLYHGYDANKEAVWANPITGASPYVWDRALGWYFMSLLETISVMPTTHKGYAKLIGYFESIAAGLLRAQDSGSGGWWLIMGEEYAGADGNYVESSGTAIFTYGLFKGLRMGILKGAEYLASAKKAYGLMVKTFVVEYPNNGTLGWKGTVAIGSLKGNATYEYYTSVATDLNDYLGAGPFMMAAYECAILDK